jgi:G3E family GTPase
VGGGGWGRAACECKRRKALQPLPKVKVNLLARAYDASHAPARRRPRSHLQALLRALNPGAALICVTGDAPIDATGSALVAALTRPQFDWDATQRRAGWLAALEHSSAAPSSSAAPGSKPPDGGCFVYRARWPFHPGRLHSFFVGHFVLQQRDWGLGDGPGDEAGSDGGSSGGGGGGGGPSSSESGSMSASSGWLPTPSEVAARRSARQGAFGRVVRSKGFVWLASRGDHMGEWSQAGDVLSFTTGKRVAAAECASRA